MEEVAGGGAADRGTTDVGAGVINTHHSQSTDALMVLEALAEAAVAGDLFHRPQEHSLHRHQLLCHLMHRTSPTFLNHSEELHKLECVLFLQI
jgi:hypothetical protein